MQLPHAPSGHVPRHASNPELLSRSTTSRRQLAGALLVGALAATATPAYASTEHVVAHGDSLWSLAKAHSTSVAAIAEANGLANPDLILVGATLVIPDASPGPEIDATGADPDVHIVEPGETLWRIADHYGIGVGQLARQNSLEGADPIIYPGQELVITPGTGERPVTTESSAEAPADDQEAISGTRRYVVVAGDTLWAIADRNGVASADLLVANGLTDADVLHVGDELVIPGTPANLPDELAASTARRALVPVFDHWAAEYNVPADLLKALTWFESGWNNEKVSSAGAIGIGQLLPITTEFVSEYLLGTPLDPHVPEQNIQLSARYMRYLLDNTGDDRLALAAYFQGLTATRQHGIYRSSLYYVDGIQSLRARFV